jgi:hypothetical protein
VRFLFDRHISLYSRVIREDRAGVALSDEVQPDLDALPPVLSRPFQPR